MWIYERKLQIPVRVSEKNIPLAKYLITQYGGPDGELSAALRYLNQRYTMPEKRAKALLTDIGTEELGHLEVIATLVYKLLKDATPEEMKKAGLGSHFADHEKALFYVDASGNPWTATYIQAKGDPIADLAEDIAAEEKARATYEALMKLTDDADVKDVLRYLRQREVVHALRFQEALTYVKEHMSKTHREELESDDNQTMIFDSSITPDDYLS